MVDCPVDPASDVILAYIAALKAIFSPTGPCPPVEGGTEVRFLTGDAPGLAAFDMHTASGKNCGEPFLWVRLARRYRTTARAFPAPLVDVAAKCNESPRAISIEVGVARCSVTCNERATWADYEREAEMSLDDSWRIENTLCKAAAELRKGSPGRLIGSDVINPVGPEGCVYAWVGTAYVTL